jgi:xylulokinase
VSREHILVHDLGTTGNKACLFNEQGELLAKQYQRYETYYPRPNWVEQRPEDWWQAVCKTTHAVLTEARVSPNEVGCVTWSGQMMGCIPIDQDGNLLQEQVMIWADSRATEEADTILDHLGGWEAFYDITAAGQSVTRYSVAKILWLKKHSQEVYSKAHKFLHTKDYLTLLLTGEKVTDYTDAFNAGMLDIKKDNWSDEILRAADIDRRKLPELRESVEKAGYIREEAAKKVGLKEGTPVVVGSGDVPAAAAGAGIVKRGSSYICNGSACWTGYFSNKPVFDPQSRISCHRHVVPGKYAPHNYTYSGAICMDWIKDVAFSLEEKAVKDTERSIYDLIDLKAQQIAPGSEGLFFLPYMRGGGAPHYDDSIKGTFLGLTLAHNKNHLARSVYEGVALNTRIIQETFEELGARIENIRLIGGGALSALWRQIFADVIGKDILRLEFVHEANSLGSAIAGGIGIGLFKDFGVINDRLKVLDVNKPRTEVHEKYNKVYSVFKDAYRKIAPLYNRMLTI